ILSPLGHAPAHLLLEHPEGFFGLSSSLHPNHATHAFCRWTPLRYATLVRSAAFPECRLISLECHQTRTAALGEVISPRRPQGKELAAVSHSRHERTAAVQHNA